MKTVSSKLLGAVAMILVLTFVFASMPVIKADALSYSGSSSYASGKYYRALTAITLSGVQRADIVAVAKSQVGYQEGSGSSQLSGEVYGGSNYTEYGRWYGMQDMWCAMFVSWCANVAGISSSIITYHAYTPSGLSWFRNQGLGYSRSTVANGGYTPIAGDIIYFKSSRNSNTTNHIGIVTGYSGSTIYTIEGNTSSATVSTNGGAVAAKSYSIYNTYIVYVCKPNYTTGNNTAASSYVNNIDVSGTESTSATNSTVSQSITTTMGDTFHLQGWSVHSDGIAKFQWNINSTSWGDMPEGASSFRQDVADAYSSYKACDTVNAFGFELSTGGLNVGANTIDIRGCTDKGATYSVARFNIFVYPVPGSTYLSVDKTFFALDEGVEFKAKGANDLAWVGLFAKDDVPGEVASYLWYEMGSNEVSINLLKSDGVRKNSRGDVTPGNYKLCLFVDQDYTVDQEIAVTITEGEGAHYSLDFPETTFTIDQGDSFFSAGWALHPSGIASFYYTVDGGTKVGMTNVGARDDLYSIPTYAPYAEACADLNYYDCYISTANWTQGEHIVRFFAQAVSGYEIKLGTVSVTVDAPPVRLTPAETSSAVIVRTDKLEVVKNIASGSTVEDIKTLFTQDCTIVDKDGAPITNGVVGTGCKVRYYNGEEIDDELVVIVTADVDGDGISNGKDLIRMKKFIANAGSIDYEMAADVNGDGIVTEEDVSAAVGLMG